MKRKALLGLLCAFALSITGMAPAAAAEPISIIGRGTTMVQDYRIIVDGSPRTTPMTVTVATVKQNGTIDVAGLGTKPVNCTYSWTLSRVTFALARTEPAGVGGYSYLLLLSEGRPGIPPYALVLNIPPLEDRGGICGTGYGENLLPVQGPSGLWVPEMQFHVVGG